MNFGIFMAEDYMVIFWLYNFISKTCNWSVKMDFVFTSLWGCCHGDKRGTKPSKSGLGV